MAQRLPARARGLARRASVDLDANACRTTAGLRSSGCGTRSAWAAFGRGEPPWAHDYPRAERNFTRILEEITLIRPHLDESNIFTMDDPELFTYPIAYMSEPGFWLMTDEELAGTAAVRQEGRLHHLRRLPRRQHWYNFSDQVQRMIPGGQLVQLDSSHPIFHSFFDINVDETRGLLRPGLVPRRL